MNLVMTGASEVTGRCYTTLLVLARFADDNTGQCWPGMRAISFLSRQSLRTTVWAIDELTQAGWIEVEKKGGKGGCNLYTLALARFEAGSVRRSKHHRKASPKPLQHDVEKPVESLRKSCGRTVEKPAPNPVQSANSGNGIIKEYLVRGNNKEKTEPATTGGVLFDPVFSRARFGVADILARINRTVTGTARGAPPRT
jgi:hypothetical protein